MARSPKRTFVASYPGLATAELVITERELLLADKGNKVQRGAIFDQLRAKLGVEHRFNWETLRGSFERASSEESERMPRPVVTTARARRRARRVAHWN